MDLDFNPENQASNQDQTNQNNRAGASSTDSQIVSGSANQPIPPLQASVSPTSSAAGGAGKASIDSQGGSAGQSAGVGAVAPTEAAATAGANPTEVARQSMPSAPATQTNQKQSIQKAASAPPHSKRKILLLILLLSLLIILSAGVYFLFFTMTGKNLLGLSSSSTLSVNQASVSPTEQSNSSIGPSLPTGSNSSVNSGTATSTNSVTTNKQQNDSQRKSDLAQLQTALEAYKIDHGNYPVAADYIKISSNDNQIAQSLVEGGYLNNVPSDPKSSDGWWYGYKSVDGENYILTARLEDETDPAGVVRGDIVLYELTNQSAL